MSAGTSLSWFVESIKGLEGGEVPLSTRIPDKIYRRTTAPPLARSLHSAASVLSSAIATSSISIRGDHTSLRPCLSLASVYIQIVTGSLCTCLSLSLSLCIYMRVYVRVSTRAYRTRARVCVCIQGCDFPSNERYD